MTSCIGNYKDCVRSADGTLITFDVNGNGPGIIILPGVLAQAFNYKTLSELLIGRFTVYVIERRGRGLSGPQGGIDYSLFKECEDLEAVQMHTGAQYLFGHSYGGLIALEYAKRFTGFKKIAVYEPGVSLNGSIATDWVFDYAKFLSEEDYKNALALFIKMSGTPFVRKLPLWLIKATVEVSLGAEKREQFYNLLRSNLLEHLEIANSDNSIATYKSISTPMLLLYGKKTKLRWAHKAIDTLHHIYPNWDIMEFPGLDHFGPEKSPQTIAAALQNYFYNLTAVI